MKLINLPHKVCDYTCMVNGLEDLYEWKTGTRLPDWFFFYLSGMAGFFYLKSKNAPIQRMVGWGTRVKLQNEVLAEVMGFEWHASEGRSFPYSLKQAKESIDRGAPVILGALDMYHLPYYEKFYHRFHVPIHYVMMVGYDEQVGTILVHDCGRSEVQAISYADLQQAWNVSLPGFSEKNTLFTFVLDEHLPEVASMAQGALRKKAKFMLEPPASMFGVAGMRKLKRELPGWPQELDAKQLKACLLWLVEYTGNPPLLPSRIIGPTEAPNDHSGGARGWLPCWSSWERTAPSRVGRRQRTYSTSQDMRSRS